MKNVLIRLLLAAGVTLTAIALASSSRPQQADQDPSTATPRQQQPSAEPQTAPSQEAQMPASGDTQTHESHAFSGRVLKENGKIVLKDPVTKVSYQFDDESKAKPYVGKQVKVTGKLDMNTNTIHVDTIAPLS